MTASIRVQDETALIAEDELRHDHDNDDDDAAAPYTWLDSHTNSDSGTPAEEGIDFADVDIDHVPTLQDVIEHSFVFGQDDSHDDGQKSEGVLEPSALAHHGDNEAALADHEGGSSQPPMQGMEEVFNQVRRDPVLLRRALMALACTFQVIAATALWRAIGDRVIVTALVPPLVYASIGVVAYLLGMRYLRIHFAQVRVSYKDWLLCEQVMVAADNGVMLKARFGTAYLIWEQLLGIAQDDDYYYLLIEPSQGFKVTKQGVSDPELKIKLDDLASLTKAKALQGN